MLTVRYQKINCDIQFDLGSCFWSNVGIYRGKSVFGPLKNGRKIPFGDEGKSLAVSGIEYPDSIKKNIFLNIKRNTLIPFSHTDINLSGGNFS